MVLEGGMRPRSGSFVSQHEFHSESLGAFTVQVLIPFLICGFGNLGAGQLLDMIQHWPVFLRITELYVLVPSLMGLKGNLEMTMAARLSTAANCGILDKWSEILIMTKGNLALIQCQATVVGFLASMMAIAVDTTRNGNLSLMSASLLCSSAIVTANIASILLSSVMILVVIGCRKRNINPDNVATPIASSLGDVTTVALLGVFASLLFKRLESEKWLSPSLALFFLCLVPLSGRYAHQNKFTREVVSYGWTPIIMAMIISSVSGLILDHAIMRFENIAPFQPVINGVGGNLVAIQASRLSTYLHQQVQYGVLPDNDSSVCVSPCAVFCGKNAHSKPARILLIMSIPTQILYFIIIVLIKGEQTTFLFALMYVVASFIQVFILLHFSRAIVYWLWRRSSDPDNSAIPLLTAMGDLLGTAFLTLGFIILTSTGQPVM